MRILYLVHRFPYPPDKGDKIRSFHWLHSLTRHHEVHLVTLIDDPTDAVHMPEVESRCASVVVVPMRKFASKLRALCALISGASLSLALFQERQAHAAARQVLQDHDIDLILEFSAATAKFLVVGDEVASVFVEGQNARRIPRVLDMVDVDSQKFFGYAGVSSPAKRMLLQLEAKRLRKFERECVQEHDATLLCTDQEADLLRDFADVGRIAHVKNGAVLPPNIPDCGARPHLVFVGAMDYQANVDAVVWGAEEIMPLILKTHPDARFLIVGRNPTKEVKALASLPGIEVHENAPDVGVFLRGAAAALIPLRVAQGIQNKVLEAMAHRLPVITNPRVAAALDATPGTDILVAASPSEYARHVTAMLDSPEASQAIGDAGRALVEKDFTWEASYDALEAVLQDVLRSAQS